MSPTNIFAVAETTTTIGSETVRIPVMVSNICAQHMKETNKKLGQIPIS